MPHRPDPSAGDPDPGPVPGTKAGSDRPLQRNVDGTVPAAERLPERADENPVSRQVREHSRGDRDGPGPSTLEGGDDVPE